MMKHEDMQQWLTNHGVNLEVGLAVQVTEESNSIELIDEDADYHISSIDIDEDGLNISITSSQDSDLTYSDLRVHELYPVDD